MVLSAMRLNFSSVEYDFATQMDVGDESVIIAWQFAKLIYNSGSVCVSVQPS